MRNIKYFLVLVVSLFFSLNSCIEKKTNVSKLTNDTKANKTPKKEIVKKNNPFKYIYNVDLVGMEASEKIKDTKPYEKYSVDFTAACYSSNLLKIRINNEIVSISNYNDSRIEQSFHISDTKIQNDSLIIESNSPNYFKIIIVKVKNAQVYSLEYKGNLEIDVKMSKFISRETDLFKFGGIDCDDFGG